MKKILIVGCNGFIGKACSIFFSSSNSIVGCDIHMTSDTKNYFQIKSASDFATLFSKFSFDICINASGSAGVPFSFLDSSADRILNFDNVVSLSETILNYNQNCRLIHFSSAAVYGNPISLPVNEEMPKAPLSPYGINKLDAEVYLKKQYSLAGLKSCSMRVFSAYGPGLHKQIFWDIFCKANKSESITLFGTGRESRDFIFIDDLVKCIELIIQKDFFYGDAINIASGIEVSIFEAASAFLANLDTSVTFCFSGSSRKGDPVNWRADISKLSKLGFYPSVDFHDGIRRTLQEYKQYFSRIE